jgi:hypothetical protein
MTRILQISALFVMVGTLTMATPYEATDIPWKPEIKLVAMANLPGSFVSSQAIYADSERIFAGSYQGDLFVLERDRQANFPWIQTIQVGAPLTAVRGDEDNVYVASRDGNLYVFSKTWPLQLVQLVPLSSYGLAALEIVGPSVYVAKGQSAMTASKNRLYISGLNPGDIGLEVASMRSYGEQFEPGRTLVFDRQTLQMVGTIANFERGAVRVSTWQDFVYFTKPGCCGVGIDIYDAVTLKPVQFIYRSTNTVAGTKRKGILLLLGGSEAGAVDLYMFGTNGYEFTHTADLRTLTGFNGVEDIEIRSLWVDGLDNLVFAGSSWGNASSRSPDLPSVFVLEIR